MKWTNITYSVIAPILALIVIGGCGSINPSSGPATNTTTTNNNSTTNQSATLCPTTAPAFAGGSGTQSSPYIIQTACHLMSMMNNTSYWGSSFLMEADIDLTGVTFSTMIEFSGFFEGGGHTISNWNGNTPLFIWNQGTIQNLNIRNFNMTPMGSVRPGLLVGTNFASAVINNCTATGSISGLAAANLDSDNDIYWFVGGLVGINDGTVSHSTAMVNVSGLQAIGGLVGQNEGLIQTSYATGNVTATTSGSGFGAGGLVGTHSAGTVENSYSTGIVQGVAEVGGLVGFAESTIQDSFSSGAVNGSGTDVGGLIGLNSGGAISSCYWDMTASGQTTSSGGTGETTAAMQTSTTYASWDFTNTWNAPVGGYPTLR